MLVVRQLFLFHSIDTSFVTKAKAEPFVSIEAVYSALI